MASCSRSEAVIALGKRLAAQLDDNENFGAVWLSHLLAERLLAIEAATIPETKVAAEAACTALVFDLWRHQADFPKGTRPFHNLDTILRTLESLDIDHHPFRYYRLPLQAADAEVVPGVARQWLDLALGVDATARELIRLALSEAVGTMGDDMQEWMELARAAGADEPGESIVVSFLLEAGEQDNVDLIRKQRQRRLDRLNSFIELAQGLAEELAVGLTSVHANSDLDENNSGLTPPTES